METKKRWLKALRSGKYNQGAKALRSMDDKFCCLGVYCDITGDSTQWVEEPGIADDCYYNTRYESEYMIRIHELEETVNYVLIAFNDGISETVYPSIIVAADKLYTEVFNKEWDGKPLTFVEIADVVENQWKNTETS